MITEEQITQEAFKYHLNNNHGLMNKSFADGAKWMQEQSKTSFLDFIQSTELSQNDKDLVNGVFYDWLNK